MEFGGNWHNMGLARNFFPVQGLLIASAISRNLFFFMFKIKAREQVVV
jgi:hypothetical protein